MTKKKCLTSLSWSHLLSKCWSALTCSWSAVQSWNSTLEWSLVGSKTQPKDKETRTSQETDLWLSFFLCNLVNAEMRSAGTFFPHEAHAFSRGFYLLMHSGEPTEKWRKTHSWLMLTDEKPFIYTCTFANIFSCLVNLGPVGAGRIFPFMAEVRMWWAMKIKKDEWGSWRGIMEF